MDKTRQKDQERPEWPTVDPSDDLQLAERMLKGEQRAFDEFFNSYFDRLYRFALIRVNQDAATAQDVVQQSLCKAVEKIALYRGESALFTWLCRICRNTIVDTFRASDRPRRLVVPFEDSDEIRFALESLSSLEMDNPEQQMLNTEIERLVRVVLDYLPRRYGQVLEWKYIEGWSVREIAHSLGLAPKAAESLLTRARNAFREGFAALGLTGELEASLGQGQGR